MTTERIPKAQQASRTRAVILEAARRRFGEMGYDKTTIRAVAADANIDASMVMRYFANKVGLFAAAADIDLQLPNISSVPRNQLGENVVQHFLEKWDTDESGAPLRVLLSSSLAGSAAAEKMTQIFHKQLEPVIARMNPANEGEANQRAGLIASQMLGFALSRYVLRLPPIVSMSHESVIKWLGPTIQHYLDAQPPRELEPQVASGQSRHGAQ